eukprot:2714930-Rhodomonas_salina.1
MCVCVSVFSLPPSLPPSLPFCLGLWAVCICAITSRGLGSWAVCGTALAYVATPMMLCSTWYCDRVCCYAMRGTELAHGGSTDIEYGAMLCAAHERWGMPLPYHPMHSSLTYDPTFLHYHDSFMPYLSTHSPILTAYPITIAPCPISLQVCGTEIAYGGWLAREIGYAPILSLYDFNTHCP